MIVLPAAVFAASALFWGCGKSPAVRDGRARPSSCGRLQVKDGKLSSESGEPVMLRGVSLNGLITSESFLNEDTFRELAANGANLIRLAMYTCGVGTIGCCTKGDKDRHRAEIQRL